MTALLLAGGIVLLLAGGDLLVRGAVALARRIGVSPLLIGLTLVGFGTSTPELVTSLHAAMIGSPGIAIGNVVGSNIANILLILGIAALIRPLAVEPRAFRRDGAMLVASALACAVVVLIGTLQPLLGAAFVAGLAAYVVYTYRREKTAPDASAAMHSHEADAAGTAPMGLPLALLLTVAGLALTIVGARLLVTGAVDLAQAVGLSETVIGLTIVAIGTSLPELITSTMAALRREGDVALGNVVGSNIYNVLGILGVTAMVEPIAVPPQIAQFDIWVMLLVTAALIVFGISDRRLSRIEAAVLLTAYAAYLAALIINPMG